MDTTGIKDYIRYGGNVYQQAEAFITLENLEKENEELKAGIEWDDKDELIVHLEADKNRLEKENEELKADYDYVNNLNQSISDDYEELKLKNTQIIEFTEKLLRVAGNLQYVDHIKMKKEFEKLTKKKES